MSRRQTEGTGFRYRPQLIAVLLLGVMAVSWSSGFIGYRYAADQGGVMLASFWRFLLAALILLPWGLNAIRMLGWRQTVRQSWVGVFAIAGFLTPIAKAIEWGLAPGLAAVIANLLPVAIVGLAVRLPDQQTSQRQLAGLAVCLAGMLVSSFSDVMAQEGRYWLCLLPVLGVLSLAISSMGQRGEQQTAVPALGVLFIQATATLPIFALLAWQEGSLAPVFTSGFISGVGWLALVSTLGGYGFYWICLRRYSMQTVSAALFLTPLITMLWASIQFDEPLTHWGLAGSTLTLAGVWFFATRKRERPIPVVREPASSPDLNA
jgi:drug/metabolite transporter (DMT)-like permease